MAAKKQEKSSDSRWVKERDMLIYLGMMVGLSRKEAARDAGRVLKEKKGAPNR